MSSGRCAALAVAAAIASGVPSEIVKAVVQGRGAGRPSRVQTRWLRAFGLEVQQRAIQRVAGGACRHGGLQGRSVQALGQRFLHRLKGGQGRFRRLAIAGIGNAFAAPGMAAMADFGHDGDRFGLGAPADGEGAGDRPAFDAGGKLGIGIGWKSF